MKRADAVKNIGEEVNSPEFFRILSDAITYRTESQLPDSTDHLHAYLDEFIIPWLNTMGFRTQVFTKHYASSPFLVASRYESENLPTLLSYAHGDVVPGDQDSWSPPLSPWSVTRQGNKCYGRGTADNKGQHLVNLFALQRMIEIKNGKLGFNIKLLMEMGEENGSQGLHQFCREHSEQLKADVFIASDGPRLNASSPTIFLGSRGVVNLKLEVNLRNQVYHSGNWGGLLKNPAIILSNAISCVMDKNGCCNIPDLMPVAIPPEVRAEIADLPVGGLDGDPVIDLTWGGEQLSPGEKLFGWNTFEVLALQAGNPAHPSHAIPSKAVAYCHIRYVVGTEPQRFVSAIQDHLAMHGFGDVTVALDDSHAMKATRLNPQNAWVRWASRSLRKTLGNAPVILPNLGGSIPNDAFSEILALPTIWIPHSYPACAQHAPDEHNLVTILQEGLAIMAGIYWDLGDRLLSEEDLD
ncbi:M20 family metallopeptidase [Erwiniaceae bacterium L1_55_4]|nr:M20 family metallopeptidase [Erwiniaceae bacterium L1_55_4]